MCKLNDEASCVWNFKSSRLFQGKKYKFKFLWPRTGPHTVRTRFLLSPQKSMQLFIWTALCHSIGSGYFRDQGWVAQSMVSFNHWLISIKTNTLSRYKTLVNANHASSNWAQALIWMISMIPSQKRWQLPLWRLVLCISILNLVPRQRTVGRRFLTSAFCFLHSIELNLA